MLESLITSKTRIKLLMKFFLNSATISYLRDLAAEYGESTNAIRLELNHLESAGLLQSSIRGNKKLFTANIGHPLYPDIRRLLLKHTGIDQVIESVVTGLGGLEQAYLTGSFAHGRDSQLIELLLIGSTIDEAYLVQIIDKVQSLIKREIRYTIMEVNGSPVPKQELSEALLLWEMDNKPRN